MGLVVFLEEIFFYSFISHIVGHLLTYNIPPSHAQQIEVYMKLDMFVWINLLPVCNMFFANTVSEQWPRAFKVKQTMDELSKTERKLQKV